MSTSYRMRNLLGQVAYRRPRKTTPALRAEIRARYLRREAKQMELALEYHVSQSTIARCVAEYFL